MAKMTNTKSLVSGALLKWIVTIALLTVLILLISTNMLIADSGVIVIAAIAMLVPSAIAFALYFSWYSKYAAKTGDTSGTSTEGLKQKANSSNLISSIVNLAFAILGALFTSIYLNGFGDIAAINIFLIVSAIVFSGIDFVIFHINRFNPNYRN